MHPPLLEHQIAGLEWLSDRPRALIADEPGLGKSAQALLKAKEPILVCAPAMVLDSGTWDDEVERWRPGADVTQVSYSSLNTREKTGNGHGTRPTTKLKPELAGRWGTVILDEAHYVKSRDAKWTLAVKALDTEFMILLTGTPLPNWAYEAFVLLQLIFPEEAKPGRRFGSYWRWVADWFEVGEKTDRNGRVLAKMAVGDFRRDRTWAQFREANWGDRMILRLREDCLDLPPLTVTPWLCRMKGEQLRVYRALEKDFVAWLSNGHEVAAWNNAAQMVKLAKCGFGLESLAPGEGVGSAKLDALRSILRDRPRPTLVVGHFRDSVDACARSADEVGASVRVVNGGTSKNDRAKFVREFQSGNLQVLCATIDTIGEGLTLHQGGADQVIRAERSYRPSRNEQVIRRLHRMGVEVPVQVIDLITEDSMDQRVLSILETKSDEQVKALGINELLKLARPS